MARHPCEDFKLSRRERRWTVQKGRADYSRFKEDGLDPACPYSIPSERAELWFEGWHQSLYEDAGASEAVSIEESHAIHDLAKAAFSYFMVTGIQLPDPFRPEFSFDPQDWERQDLWMTSFFDFHRAHAGGHVDVSFVNPAGKRVLENVGMVVYGR